MRSDVCGRRGDSRVHERVSDGLGEVGFIEVGVMSENMKYGQR